MALKNLTAAQCILLTVHYASESNIQALHSFTPSRLDVLDPELVLRIVLTYLPETLEPDKYTTYIGEVASRLYLDVSREDVEVDLSPVKDIDNEQASKRVKKLRLCDIKSPSFPPHAPEDLLTRFLCYRAYRIDSETGSLTFVQRLVEPFLKRNDYIRIWYISVVLPLLRRNTEYYPADDGAISLSDFEEMDGQTGTDYLLERVVKSSEVAEDSAKPTITRDVKGLVGPWMYGHTDRKQRRLDKASGVEEKEEGDPINETTQSFKKIDLSGVSEADKTGHDWEYVYKWIVKHAQHHFSMITQLIEDWQGPADLDVAGLDTGYRGYLDYDVQQKLDVQYAQAAFASCYAAGADTDATIRGAHNVLARLAELMDFIPPPDLATSVDSLPRIEGHANQLDESQDSRDLDIDNLLAPEHPLTTPRIEAYMLLQMIIYSAYQFSGLEHKISIVSVAKLHFFNSAEEQLSLLQRILKGLAKSGRKSEAAWVSDRAKLIWLWNWGIDPPDNKVREGAGVLGKIEKTVFEQEMLKAFVDTNCYQIALKIFLEDTKGQALTPQQVEDVVVDKTLEAYDGASNGNKTRGGIKKANDIISAFRPHFPHSKRFAEITALIAATHALSFYSLTLQHGVPFKPVSIRVSKDPLDLISKVLEQNPRSYAKLDDLVEIAQNLASAGLDYSSFSDSNDNEEQSSDVDIEQQRKDATRRVTFMAIEAALREDDFETAYSYVVSRLTPSTTEISAPLRQSSHVRNTSTSSTLARSRPIDDDISWRAAYLAGRHRPVTSSPPTLRRLEQRTELLSLALLLAPASAITDILSAWRRCEEETSALHLAQQEEERAFDDHADRKESSALPGNFTLSGEAPEMILNQRRRELGRMATSRVEAETPVSMFDLTRSAARAISRNVNLGQIRPSTETSLDTSTESLRPRDSGEFDEGDPRVRRRDMVANAVSGGLASGIGWVLGTKPVNQ